MGGCITEIVGKTREEAEAKLEQFYQDAEKLGLLEHRAEGIATQEQDGLWYIPVWVHS